VIPVLGVPVLTGPDLLNNMLDSVTEPIDHLIIIDNGQVVKEIRTSAKTVDIVQMPNNIGVAASWNLIIKSTPRAAWWLIANYDIEFQPTALKNLVKHSSPNRIVTSSKGWAAFTIGANVISKVGLFDEGIGVPAYHEDTDFERRSLLAGIEILEADGPMTHLDHTTVADMKWDLKAMVKNAEANYIRKWGGTYRRETRTESPLLDWNIDQWR